MNIPNNVNYGYDKIFNAYLMHSQIFSNINPKFSFLIKLFSYKKIYLQHFGCQDKKLFSQLEEEKYKLKLPKNIKIHEIMKSEEVLNVLEKLFCSVDIEEKSNLVDNNTAAVFRMISDLIDILIIYNPSEIDGKWIKISNYI